MSRFTSIKRLVVAVLTTGGVVMACRAAQPGEAPPLAPRPEAPATPTADPVPGAPDPLDTPPGTPGPQVPSEDAGIDPTQTNPGPVSMTEIQPQTFKSAGAVSMQAPPTDAGVGDAGGGGGAPNDARVPDARDGGTGLPPVPDARIPPDGGLTPPRI